MTFESDAVLSLSADTNADTGGAHPNEAFVVKVTKYLTDIRDQDGVVAVLKEYFGSWTPASTAICLNQLSMPGARIELDMIAAFPPGK